MEAPGWDWVIWLEQGNPRLEFSNVLDALAALRNLAISLLRLAGRDNIAQATRHIARDVTRAAKLILTT